MLHHRYGRGKKKRTLRCVLSITWRGPGCLVPSRRLVAACQRWCQQHHWAAGLLDLSAVFATVLYLHSPL